MFVLMTSTGPVAVVVTRPVIMLDPRWVAKSSPPPVIHIQSFLDSLYVAHCAAVKTAARACKWHPVHKKSRKGHGRFHDLAAAVKVVNGAHSFQRAMQMADLLAKQPSVRKLTTGEMVKHLAVHMLHYAWWPRRLETTSAWKFGGQTIAGTVPRHRPRTPSDCTTPRITSEEVRYGFSLLWRRVFTRSMGFEASEATLPLIAPAAMLRSSEGLSFLAPMSVFVGP